jgi:23S rRNA (uracil1939-C5)-methyltransferase
MDLVFRISARSFFQVNPAQALVLYRQVAAYADLTGEETVVDAFSGPGTIALFLAGAAARVTGIEEVPEAVADARQNAARNGIMNVEFLAGRVEEVLGEMLARSFRPDVVVLDPPRAGVAREALETIARLGPRRLVYVSCNPATLARDLGILQGYGYRTLEVQPVDMFPQTTHVEAVARLMRV